MPCYSDYGPPSSYSDPIKTELDKVTRLLCGLCSRASAKDMEELIGADMELVQWWHHHLVMDRLRREPPMPP